MSEDRSLLARILALAQAQRPDPEGWSLVVDRGWLERSYLGTASRILQTLTDGELGGCASVRSAGPGEPAGVTITSMLRPGCERLWGAQLAWIAARVDESRPVAVRVVSECLSEAEAVRWAGAGYELVFEELAMERDLREASAVPATRWTAGTTLLEWGPAAAAASFEVYEAAFRERPGFPGWSRSEWIDRLTGDADFRPSASLCAVRSGEPAGFVVCSNGWVDQVGVAPPHRRQGLASALVTEATTRMRRLGIGIARLHVNTDNPVALEVWLRLGWRESGRRGRFEPAATRSVVDTS